MKLINNIKGEKKSLGKKFMYSCLALIPFISILVVIMFRHTYIPTNEEILENLRNEKNYSSIVDYTIINSRGKYNQKVNLTSSEEEGLKIDFGSKLTKIYDEDKIRMKYNEKGREYEIDRSLDLLYPLASIEEIFKNSIESVEDGQEEWGDLKYIEVKFKLIDKNKHLDKAILYIDKNKKIPLLMNIYDDKGEERVKIVYREFSYQ